MPTHALASLGRVSEKFDLDGEVLAEEDAAPGGAEQPTRALRPTASPASPVLRTEVRTAAIAAAGGVLAGRRDRRRGACGRGGRRRRRSPRRLSRRKRRRPNVVASRSFLVDVHLLGRERRLSPALELEVRPPSPFRLPRHGGEDGVMSVRDGVASRLLLVEDSPVLVRAWEAGRGRVVLRAEPVDPGAVARPAAGDRAAAPPPARPQLALGVERMRFALGVDDDLTEFYRRFRRDPLLGPPIRRRPWLRPRRRPWPWEALAWAVVKQLIETGRAAGIQRRIVGRWGVRLGAERAAAASDVPSAPLIAGRAPAELEAMGLSPKRSIALAAVARQIAAGRVDPGEPGGDRRLLAVPEIGPWTVQCLGLFGRGDPDSLPAGDLDLPEAGRPPGAARPPRDGRGGRGVLRPV